MDYKMIMNRPASWWNDNWREGSPIGNGLHGALVYGATVNERIMLTHTKLWREGHQPDLPDVSDVLLKMRQAILDGQVDQADSMLVDALKNRGYQPTEAFPFPAATLHLTLPTTEGFSHYRREVCFSTAQAVVSYNEGKEKILRRAFVSRADDVVVIEADGQVEVSLTAYQTDRIYEHQVNPHKKAETLVEGEWIYFKVEIGEKEHGVVAHVIRGRTTLILCKVFTEGTHLEMWPRLKQEIEVLPADYDILLERHLPAHQALYQKCELILEDEKYTREMSNRALLDAAYDEGLPNVLIERMWAYGRYLLVCGTQKGGLPCNLTGIWNGEWRPFWAFNMANINLEMIYWQALPGRMAELMLPVFDYYEAHLEDLRENARKIYGCRGIYLPAVSTPGGLKSSCMAPHIVNWTAGAGWIAQHYYEYWAFTRDQEFLMNRAMPFLREVGLFYEDFLVWEKDRWHIYPSVSPENHGAYYKDKGELPEFMQTSIDATMDIAIVKEIFSHLIEWGGMTGVANEELVGWQKILEAAPPYETNEYGGIREWLHPDFPDNERHRHQSHLYPVFPGLELARSDQQTLEKYRVSGIRRMTEGLAYQTSWSFTQNANLLARCKDGENALKNLSLIAKSTLMENLWTVHNDWRGSGISLRMDTVPFQIDANMGWTAAVQEMLLFSNLQCVELLPALPNSWKKGSIGPLDTRCGVSVKIKWDRIGESLAIIKANRDTDFILNLPNGESQQYKLVQDEEKQIRFQLQNRYK